MYEYATNQRGYLGLVLFPYRCAALHFFRLAYIRVRVAQKMQMRLAIRKNTGALYGDCLRQTIVGDDDYIVPIFVD